MNRHHNLWNKLNNISFDQNDMFKGHIFQFTIVRRLNKILKSFFKFLCIFQPYIILVIMLDVYNILFIFCGSKFLADVEGY